jgi:hypothetical protein
MDRIPRRVESRARGEGMHVPKKVDIARRKSFSGTQYGGSRDFDAIIPLDMILQ